jgi:hypothetical protein
MSRRPFRASWWAFGLSPLAAVFFFASPAPAGPPGPWVFIPPPGSSTTSTGATMSTTTAATTTATVGPKGTATSAVTPVAVDGMDRSKKATVVLERNKKPIALGILLEGKPFILTARSPIVAGTGDVDVKFPETNFTTKARMVHEDAAWDLAILVPQSAAGQIGAKASDVDPLSTTVSFSSFVLLKTGKVQPQGASILGRRDFLSPDGETLKDALSIDNKALAIGTPIVDGTGGVVAMITRACAPGSPKVTVAGKGVCMPQLFGVPLSQVKKFLKSAPPDPHPFTAVLGVNGATDPMGVRVTEVKPGSAAFAAGIKPNDDIIVSVDAQVVKSMDDLRERLDKHSPGDVITLLVARAGAIREVKCTLKDDSTVAAPSLPPTAYTPLPPLPPIPSVVIKPVPMKK